MAAPAEGAEEGSSLQASKDDASATHVRRTDTLRINLFGVFGVEVFMIFIRISSNSLVDEQGSITVSGKLSAPTVTAVLETTSGNTQSALYCRSGLFWVDAQID